MYNEKMFGLGNKGSAIRELFEYGRKRKEQIGEDKVFDFSLGNPSVPSPSVVNEALIDIITKTEPTKLHAYTTAIGDKDVRESIANYVNSTYGVNESASLIYLTCGAAASLTISLNALINEGDEVIALAPFFPEYRVFTEKANGKLVVVKCKDKTFKIDFESLEKAISSKTKAIIINSPNNPTGVLISEDELKELANLLYKKQKEFNSNIFIIADEPYRELVYDGVQTPFVTKFYDNTIVCYSFSKSLSLPGERIGYILVSNKCIEKVKIFKSICGAGRSLGYVCAPALFQYMIPYCLGKTSDITIYEKNRDILYKELTRMGYQVTYPNGAFYLFIKALGEDANEFSERAKKHELLLVPSDSFGVTGYIRISYCVDTDMILRSLKAFEDLINDYK